ncbi:hypothetical protein [Bacillus dakarensis]|uniref:hypothetical protein n=1 Tax=Robertmurraya dakarensis TaxID=1926278 RepID=UPI001F1657C8|nr:hypothetical protein [Bacillus dakarensis]
MMKISIEVHLNIEGQRMISQGSFEVNSQSFCADPSFTAAIEAYRLLEKIKNETGHRKTILEKATYNGTNDITKTVKEIRPVVDDSNLPF